MGMLLRRHREAAERAALEEKLAKEALEQVKAKEPVVEVIEDSLDLLEEKKKKKKKKEAAEKVEKE